MSLQHSPEHDVPYHLVSYDAKGLERATRDGPSSFAAISGVGTDAPTDLLFFSHGWNAGMDDAIEQYGHWVDTMAARNADRERLVAGEGGFRPLLVGVHWPSKAWADGDPGSTSYGVSSDNGASANGTTDSEDDWQRRLTDEYADRFGDGIAVRQALATILDAARRDAAPPTLPDEVSAAYAELDAALGVESAGPGARPGDDRQPFDAEEAYQAALLADIADQVSYGAWVSGGVLAPLRVLSFWAMKSRALAFGEGSAARLLRELRAAGDASMRVHVAGHSFGCIVASAAVGGSARPVQTLVLLQGAMSLWSFCGDIPARRGRSGYFHGLVRDRLVDGPTLVTTSRHDRAVRVFYPLGAGARGDVAYADDGLPVYGGIGTFGVRGSGVELVDEDVTRLDPSKPLRAGVIYNLDADAVIASGSGIGGAHSDICHPEIADAFWHAIARGGR